MPIYDGRFEDVIGPFVDHMRYKLQNSKRFAGTRTWTEVPLEQLVEGLESEVAELKEAMASGSAIEQVLEATDVANLAMMIADRCGMARRINPPNETIVALQVGIAPEPLIALCAHGYADPEYCKDCRPNVDDEHAAYRRYIASYHGAIAPKSFEIWKKHRDDVIEQLRAGDPA